MTATFFTSDPHIGHRFMAELRGCDGDIEKHDAMLAERWDATITKRDTVWVQGDLCMTNPNRAIEWFKERPGAKHLILGNHDAGHPMHRDSHRWQRVYFDAFESVQTAARRKIDGRNVLLSHFPYETDRGFEARFPQWRLPNLGEWLLHGHTHMAQKITSRVEIHVGVDAWDYAPVSLDQIVELMRSMEADPPPCL